MKHIAKLGMTKVCEMEIRLADSQLVVYQPYCLPHTEGELSRITLLCIPHTPA